MTTMNTGEATSLWQVKARVRGDHARLRDLLDSLERALQEQNDADPPEAASRLTDTIWKLFLILDDHLGMEERDLVPYVREAGGTVAVEHLQQEHREQRTALLAMVNECDAPTKSSAELADDARWLIGSLRKDMDREDVEFEKLSPGAFLSADGFVTDQSSG